MGFFVKEPVYEEKAVRKHMKEDDRRILSEILPVFEGCSRWNSSGLEECIKTFCHDNGYKFGLIFHPLRVAVSGKTTGPGLFEMLELLGREKVLERVKKFL